MRNDRWTMRAAWTAALGMLFAGPLSAQGREEKGSAPSRASLLSLPAASDEPTTLTQRLLQLDALRAGSSTPFAEVERQGRELLGQYRRSDERAQIYFTITRVYSQSDIRFHSDQVNRYARLALSLEHDPIRRGLLYSDLGSAAEVDPAQTSFAAQRTRAAEIWLQGYKELLPLHLPKTAPELPPVDKWADDFANPAQRRQLLREHEAQMKARMEAERVEKLIQNRNVFVQQLKEVYAREPRADAEIRRLAARILGDPQATEALLAQILPK